MSSNRSGALALEDGRIFRGESFGAESERTGEVVFNTSMSGYQEIFSDPSYKEQIIVMTCPHIGNYGINQDDFESADLHLEGVVVREYCPYPSNWRSSRSLGDLLQEKGVPGISGIDTRAVTRHIRNSGAMRGIISTADRSDKELIDLVNDYPGLVGRNLIEKVSTAEPYQWDETIDLDYWTDASWTEPVGKGRTVVVYDFGVKFNILRSLRSLGPDITVVPWNTPPDEVLALRPDGVLLSNGPGDPAGAPEAAEAVRGLLGLLPIFGICMGHQILSLALGGKTYKLKFGHRGANHPVIDVDTKKIGITSQNHGFCVDMASFGGDDVRITHWNLYDKTVEGVEHRSYDAFSVQYHPEASPGPRDAAYLFPRFLTGLGRDPGKRTKHAETG
jgi:carbamoyl-phosphate synthase small subunit